MGRGLGARLLPSPLPHHPLEPALGLAEYVVENIGIDDRSGDLLCFNLEAHSDATAGTEGVLHALFVKKAESSVDPDDRDEECDRWHPAKEPCA